MLLSSPRPVEHEALLRPLRTPYRGRATTWCRELPRSSVNSHQGRLGHVEGELRHHGVERSQGDGLAGESRPGDAVEAEDARRLAQTAPGGQVPASADAEETGGLDDADGFPTLAVAVGQLNGDRVEQRLLHDR